MALIVRSNVRSISWPSTLERLFFPPFLYVNILKNPLCFWVNKNYRFCYWLIIEVLSKYVIKLCFGLPYLLMVIPEKHHSRDWAIYQKKETLLLFSLLTSFSRSRPQHFAWIGRFSRILVFLFNMWLMIFPIFYWQFKDYLRVWT